jgi:hypothetical protein
MSGSNPSVLGWRRVLWAAALVPFASACGDDGGAGTGTNGAGASGAASGAGGQGATASGGNGTGGDAAGGGATGGDGSGGQGTGGVAAGYPAPPYGVEVGDTMANLQWEGYVNDDAQGLANSEPFVDYSMNDVRQSGKEYALIHMAAVF